MGTFFTVWAMREVRNKKKKLSPIGNIHWDGILEGIKKKKSLNQLENVTWVHIVIIQHLFTVC